MEFKDYYYFKKKIFKVGSDIMMMIEKQTREQPETQRASENPIKDLCYAFDQFFFFGYFNPDRDAQETDRLYIPKNIFFTFKKIMLMKRNQSILLLLF